MLEKLNKLKVCSFRYDWEDTENKHLGLIAQEVSEIFPQKDYNIVVEQGGFLSINYQELIPVIIKSIQELSTKIDNLKEDKQHGNHSS